MEASHRQNADRDEKKFLGCPGHMSSDRQSEHHSVVQNMVMRPRPPPVLQSEGGQTDTVVMTMSQFRWGKKGGKNIIFLLKNDEH